RSGAGQSGGARVLECLGGTHGTAGRRLIPQHDASRAVAALHAGPDGKASRGVECPGKERCVRKPVFLVTGANGEVGHGLIVELAAQGHDNIVAVDLEPVDAALAAKCRATFAGSILDRHLMERIVSEYEVREIYHLAALLSTRSEFTPETAHEVNVEGTLGLL